MQEQEQTASKLEAATVVSTTDVQLRKAVPNQVDKAYEHFVAHMNATARRLLAIHGTVFHTDVDQGKLWDIYINSFPPEQRYIYNCRCCRSFLNHFGGLVTIDQDGYKQPLAWSTDFPADMPENYREMNAKMLAVVAGSNITTPYFYFEPYHGKPVSCVTKNGQEYRWDHMHLEFSGIQQVANENQIGAAVGMKCTEIDVTRRVLGEYKIEQIETAIRVLNSEKLQGEEKVRGPIEWLHALKKRTQDVKNPVLRDNIIRSAVLRAPSGFCHIRGSSSGQLLEMIASGQTFENIRWAFMQMFDPMTYKRAQADLAAGQIRAAEKRVAELGIANSLQRRFARLSEMEMLWMPTEVEVKKPAASGVFGHLMPEEKIVGKDLEVPTVSMTFEKFRKTVLPTAKKIEYYVPAQLGNYVSMITAVDPDAPPIVAWDNLEKRNPVNWYKYHGGQDPRAYNLALDTWVEVTGISLSPECWNNGEGKFPNQLACAMAFLKGAADMMAKTGKGLGLFPDVLKSELLDIRAVIEMHSNSQQMVYPDDANAFGIGIMPGGLNNLKFRVHSDLGKQDYLITTFESQ